MDLLLANVLERFLNDLCSISVALCKLIPLYLRSFIAILPVPLQKHLECVLFDLVFHVHHLHDKMLELL